MVSISKPEHRFLRRHLKAALGFLALTLLTVAGILTLAYAEGTFSDPAGQLNNPFKLACDSGILANRVVSISEDGEYNWMFAKGQMLELSAGLNSLQNNSLAIYLISPSREIVRQNILRSYDSWINWTVIISEAGHWQFEMVNHSGVVAAVQLHIQAGSSGSFGLLNCLNPGDLFRRDE